MRNRATGKFTKKLYAVLGLGAALAVLLACAVFGVVPRGRTARAVSDAAGLTQAIAAAPTDYLTAQTVEVGAADGANGVEIEVADNITVKAGSRVHFTATDPSVVNALTHSAVDSHIVFSGSVTVEANAEVTFDCDVTFKGAVSVLGTMIVNGMALNQNTFTVQNELHDYSAIRSQGLIVGGAFNNDGANNGKLVVAQGANITVSGHSAQSVQGQQVAYDGGALFLKAASQTDLAFTNDGALAAEGTVIYDNAFTGTAPDGAQGATCSFRRTIIIRAAVRMCFIARRPRAIRPLRFPKPFRLPQHGFRLAGLRLRPTQTVCSPLRKRPIWADMSKTERRTPRAPTS